MKITTVRGEQIETRPDVPCPRERTLTEYRAAMAADDSASFYVDDERWTRNAGGQVLFDGEPLFLVVRACWGDGATPAATLHGLERQIVAMLSAADIRP